MRRERSSIAAGKGSGARAMWTGARSAVMTPFSRVVSSSESVAKPASHQAAKPGHRHSAASTTSKAAALAISNLPARCAGPRSKGRTTRAVVGDKCCRLGVSS